MESGKNTATSPAFQSPMPVLTTLRQLVFGTKEPDNYTKLTFFIVLFYWIIFQIWTIASYLTISFRELIMDQKHIPVEFIIEKRGEAIGFEPGDFLDRLLTTNGVGMICWGIVFIGLILLWRKRSTYLFFILGGILFYLGMMVFYMSYTYFKEDITLFDKMGLLICLVLTTVHYFLLKREENGGNISFFEEDDE